MLIGQRLYVRRTYGFTIRIETNVVTPYDQLPEQPKLPGQPSTRADREVGLPVSDTDAIQDSPDYYFAILPGSAVYHIAHDGETLCQEALHEKDRWYKRGSENVIPAELRLCQRCDAEFHRELTLSRHHIEDELMARIGRDRTGGDHLSKEDLAGLLKELRALTEAPVPSKPARSEEAAKATAQDGD